jgi:uncharacterized membrane protein YqaE (UPF0057 family)
MSVSGYCNPGVVIIRFANRTAVYKNDILCARNNNDNDNDNQLNGNIKLTQWIHQKVNEKWGLEPDDYYIDIRGNHMIFDIQPRVHGGNAAKAIFNMILGGIMAIFKPIVAPLAGIANAFLMLVKGVLYIIMLLMWFLKFCAWFFTEVLPSIPSDIFGMVRFISFILIDSVVGTIGYYFKKIFNAAGSTVVGAALSGWDNNPAADDNQNRKSSQPQTASEFEDSKTNGDDNTSVENQPSCEGRKCYRTEAGTVPWTVILATVLFPPAGVFMELGLHGFIQILVCLLLTFMFYFPGLIYALILLYC